MLDALRDDALSVVDDGFELRMSLPWIRSLPLAALTDIELSIDGSPAPALQVDLGGRRRAPADLTTETGWWFVQDRLVLRCDQPLASGTHTVRLAFRLAVPYLQIAPTGPLVLPFHFTRDLTTDTTLAGDTTGDAARDVA